MRPNHSAHGRFGEMARPGLEPGTPRFSGEWRQTRPTMRGLAKRPCLLAFRGAPGDSERRADCRDTGGYPKMPGGSGRRAGFVGPNEGGCPATQGAVDGARALDRGLIGLQPLDVEALLRFGSFGGVILDGMSVFSIRHRRALASGKIDVQLDERLRGRLWRLMSNYNETWSYQPDPTDNWTDTTDCFEQVEKAVLDTSGASNLSLGSARIAAERGIQL
jgi:hypothetical protein